MRQSGDLLFPSPSPMASDFTAGSVRHAMTRACDRAKIPRITIRDLRRTHATRLIENGASDVIVAQSLGHTGLRMIPRYVRSLDARQKAVDGLVENVKLRRLK